MSTDSLPIDRYFDPDPEQKELARQLYQQIAELPHVCPHGHVDPKLFSDPSANFGTPTDLFIIPDHYITRMLYSQGIALERLGVHALQGSETEVKVEVDPRKIWRIFCENFYLFRGTPSGTWITQELSQVFGIQEKPASENAERLYDLIAEKLPLPEFSPRSLFDRFNIEVLCTTDSATDNLEHHISIRQQGWRGRVLPTFRPDAVVNIDSPGWVENIHRLEHTSNIEITDFGSYLRALEERRVFFRSMGATATDHAVLIPDTGILERTEAEAIFSHALHEESTASEAARFTAHMLVEMARMSIEDGLVMQLHPGSLRNHNENIYQFFGFDKGGDIPIHTEFTRALKPLLDKYGNDSRLTLILFTLDESTYSRELAPLAGLYPALKLGPPWWFFDSPNGMRRYFDNVIETAGLYNTAGFNDDTRAFCSIPARHDVWRRVSANWVAGLLSRQIIDLDDAKDMMVDLAVGLARKTYRFQ
jgi:glucuronate isomerase